MGDPEFKEKSRVITNNPKMKTTGETGTWWKTIVNNNEYLNVPEAVLLLRKIILTVSKYLQLAYERIETEEDLEIKFIYITMSGENK
jgi:hypothetical protein